MKQNVYTVRDVVADHCINVVTAKNDAMCIRNNLRIVSQIVPLNDVRFYHVGTFDDESMELVSCPPRQVSKDAYKYPEDLSTATNDSSSFDSAVASIRNKPNADTVRN